MSLSTRAGLITHIADKLEKDEASITTQVGDWIELTEGRINAAMPPVRVSKMIVRSTASISDEFSAVPTDFLAPRSMRLTTGDKRLLQFYTPEQMAEFKSVNAATGTLLAYTQVGDEFEYGPAPDETYVVALTYYAKIPALTVSNTTNWLLSGFPQAYVAGCLLEAGIYYQDEALITQHAALLNDALDAIRANDRASQFAANPTPTPSAIAV